MLKFSRFLSSAESRARLCLIKIQPLLMKIRNWRGNHPPPIKIPTPKKKKKVIPAVLNFFHQLPTTSEHNFQQLKKTKNKMKCEEIQHT